MVYVKCLCKKYFIQEGHIQLIKSERYFSYRDLFIIMFNFIFNKEYVVCIIFFLKNIKQQKKFSLLIIIRNFIQIWPSIIIDNN